MSFDANRKPWPCNDRAATGSTGCDNNLGTIVNGELVIDLTAVKTVHTEKVNVTMTCAKCGSAKTWFAKEPAVVIEFFDLFSKRIAQKVSRNGPS